MATSQTSDIVETVIGEASRLRDFLSGLDAQTWASDSTCEGWTIEDVVAHLAGNAGGWASNITRAVAGDAGPPEGQSFLPPGEKASHPTGPAARESRRESGTQLLDAFIAGHDRLRKVLESLGDEDLDKPCFHRRGALPVKGYLGIQLQELALHGWDIRSGLDSEAELWEGPLPALVDLAPRWLRTAFTPGLDLPTPVRYRFDVSSPVAVHEDLLVTGDSYQAGQSGTEPADVVFRCSTGNYILLMFGRLQVDPPIASGRLTIEGSSEQSKNFNAWFKGF
jgi:uncharacterized protein (TIGR03083 family)